MVGRKGVFLQLCERGTEQSRSRDEAPLMIDGRTVCESADPASQRVVSTRSPLCSVAIDYVFVSGPAQLSVVAALNKRPVTTTTAHDSGLLDGNTTTGHATKLQLTERGAKSRPSGVATTSIKYTLNDVVVRPLLSQSVTRSGSIAMRRSINFAFNSRPRSIGKRYHRIAYHRLCILFSRQ